VKSRATRMGAPVLALACLAAPAGAAVPRPVWSLGITGGTTRFDAHLADYQWNLSPRPAWGAQAGVSLGRYGLALRAGVSGATQHVDASASVTDPAVNVTTFDLAGEVEVARPLGFALLARASGGRVALTYSPDRLEIDTGGGTASVELAPVHAWSWGGGAAVRHAIAPNWTATLAAERQAFSFDTAHRTGASVTVAREAFGNWNGRLELARLFGSR
jgi:opacity protein-like surface antigen